MFLHTFLVLDSGDYKQTTTTTGGSRTGGCWWRSHCWYWGNEGC